MVLTPGPAGPGTQKGTAEDRPCQEGGLRAGASWAPPCGDARSSPQLTFLQKLP